MIKGEMRTQSHPCYKEPVLHREDTDYMLFVDLASYQWEAEPYVPSYGERPPFAERHQPTVYGFLLHLKHPALWWGGGFRRHRGVNGKVSFLGEWTSG